VVFADEGVVNIGTITVFGAGQTILEGIAACFDIGGKIDLDADCRPHIIGPVLAAKSVDAVCCDFTDKHFSLNATNKCGITSAAIERSCHRYSKCKCRDTFNDGTMIALSFTARTLSRLQIDCCSRPQLGKTECINPGSSINVISA
jgi:hypothetical protein